MTTSHRHPDTAPTCDLCTLRAEYEIVITDANGELLRLLCRRHGEEARTSLDLFHVTYAARLA